MSQVLRYLFLVLALASGTIVSAQSRFSISGTVRDSSSGETMIGAAIIVAGQPTLGTVSNEYGFYSLTLPAGKYTLQISYTGHATRQLSIDLDHNLKQDIALPTAGKVLSEVLVRSTNSKDILRNAQMGAEKLTMTEMKDIPVLFGEKDVLKTLQLLPGVKTAGDGQSGFYVRGGGADQNLILLDEAVVYNPAHLLGFFSTFNSDAIKDVTLYKGTAPAQYGGRVSSVEDIHMNDGATKHYGVAGGIGLIASRLSVEGPIGGDERGSFLISGRRTYADLFLKLSSDPTYNQSQLYFYDLNGKANYKLGDKDRLFLSGYFGKDKLGYASIFGIDWGNATGTLRWNHILSSKLFSNTSLIYSDYKYNISINTSSVDIGIHSQIRDWNLKQEFSLYASPKSSFRFGINAIHHDINPGNVTTNNGNDLALQVRHSLEGAAFFSGSYKTGDKLRIDYGLRVSAFAALGSGNFYNVDEASGKIIDTLRYGNGEVAASYVVPEPRLSVSYLLNEASSLKAAYTRNAQYLHLLSNSTTGNPTDKWIPSNNMIKPTTSDQLSLGYVRQLGEGSAYEFSAETYFKWMHDVVDYRDNADVFRNDAIETQLLNGHGRAYGIELLLKKKSGKLTGWVAYTLSRSEQQIEGINGGDWYAARQDRTHDISVVGIYKLNAKWTLGATFVYYTGNATSFPSGKYNVAGNTVFYYTERNGYRMPAYHRLDLSATKTLRARGRFTSELALGLYNAYGHQNPFTITFQDNPDNTNVTEAVQTSLFRWIPSITYNIKF
jgi:hypothetical protein